MALSKQTWTWVCVFPKSHILKRSISLWGPTSWAVACPEFAFPRYAVAGTSGEEWRGGPFGGGDAGLSYPTDICRPLCHKARKISPLGANNSKWKPGALGNLRFTRFTCGVLMAGERSQGPPGHAPGALKLRKAQEDLKIHTFHGKLEEEEWVTE